MYGSANINSTSSSQRESIKSKMIQKQKELNLRKKQLNLNSTNASKGIFQDPNKDKDKNFEKTSAKKRKFGHDYRNVEMAEFDPRNDLDKFPYTETPMNLKKNKAFGNLIRTLSLSNESSRSMNLSHHKKSDEKNNFEHLENSKKKEQKDQSKVDAPNGLNKCFADCPSLPSSSMQMANNRSMKRIKRPESEATNPALEPWVRRKFYIVKNGGKTAEVYCTDFIHKVRQNLTTKNFGKEEGGVKLVRIVDKWREEWNNGVQMPLGEEKSEYVFESTSLFPEMTPSEPFELPKKLVATYPTKYTCDQQSKLFHFVSRQPICYYAMDLVDEEWLGRQSTSESPISARLFVEAMNYFEVFTYRRIHDALLAPAKSRRGGSEDDAECIVCGLPEWEPGDNIVFCDGCDIPVHQSCYGIVSLPLGEWHCLLCRHYGTSAGHGCLFCPVKGGAMKATKHMDCWAHVACALWLPEVRFGDPEAREPITHVNEIPAEKWLSRCCVCDTRNGACIKCVHPNCDASFHVGCAQQANFVLNIANDDRDPNGVKMTSLCDKHSAVSPYRDRRVRFSKNRLAEMLRNFKKFVLPKEVADQLHKSQPLIERIYEYWIWKRAQHDCLPLISEPEEPKTVHFSCQQWKGDQQQQCGSSSSNCAARRRNNSGNRRQTAAAPPPSVYDSIAQDDLFQIYEGLRMLRRDFEKGRNLCYMVTKREKIKKTSLELWQKQVQSIADTVFCPQSIIPISKRRMDKLLSEWREIAQFGNP